MATRSVVFVGDSLGVFSHWDGHPETMIPRIIKMRGEFPDLATLEDEVVTKSPAGWSDFGLRRSVPCGWEEPMNEMSREDIPDWIQFSYFVKEVGIAYRDEHGSRKLHRLSWEQAELKFGK